LIARSKQMRQSNKLFEGLHNGDLKNCVESTFTVDQYSSKMGNDRDVAVLRFRVAEKFPATDMMEFIEKGYPFVLDADISSGEEKDGKYSVFVEMERTKQFPGQINALLSGLSKLTDNYDWQFRFYKDPTSQPFTEKSIVEHIPLTPEEYDQKLNESRNNEVGEFFSEGNISKIEVADDMTVTFHKPFFESLKLKLVCIGHYTQVMESIKGPFQVDESSSSQMFYLTKYLGNYDINKVNDQFVIRKDDHAAVVKFI